MFNSELKKEALQDLDDKIQEKSDFIFLIQEKAGNLFSLRTESSQFITFKIKNYVKTLNNVPQEYVQALADYRSQYKDFMAVLDDILPVDSMSHHNDIESDTENSFKKTLATSVAAGVGTATIAPTAAIAIASTFGTASTGTAIASLYGAAATNASLAWLGGGTLATGAGGMAAGSSFLALANPVGLSLAVIGGTVALNNKNISIAENAKEEIEDINIAFYSLQTHIDSVDRLYENTDTYINKIRTLFLQLKAGTPDDYLLFSTEQKNALQRLIRQITRFSTLLFEKVE